MDTREEALQKIKVPAIGLIVTGAIGVLNSLYSILTMSQMDAAVEQAIEQQPTEEQAEAVANMMDIIQAASWPMIIIGILGAAFIVFGGVNMLKGQKKGMCMAASIVSFIPILSPCCLLGLIFGIWGIIALGKADAAFGNAVDPSTFN